MDLSIRLVVKTAETYVSDELTNDELKEVLEEVYPDVEIKNQIGKKIVELKVTS